VLPPVGRNSYAFLGQLSPEALNQVQAAFNRSPTAGAGNASTQALWGANPCAGFTAIRKVWNPQIQQFTTQKSDTWRTVAGVRGRFGGDWRWDGYYQYGETNSLSKQYNGATNLSFNLAMDAVIDDREFIDGQPNPNFGRPVCRMTRDGLPQLDANGLPMSDTAGLAALAADCKPLNVFGDGSGVAWDGLNMTSEELAQLQREALAFAFKDSSSEGYTNRQQLSFTTNGTLWDGWGAGPMTGAFGVELSQDKVDNKGTRGSFFLRSDLTSWNDSFGGKTRSTEGYTELNFPLVSGLEGINLFSINVAGRYTSYYNKGGEGTTGDSATQNTFNWKYQAVFEPFDFVRLRLTRSRDLRAAGYRDLFLNQPTLPDQTSARNWWRERTQISDENQNERFGYVRVGNPNLKPEKSDTLTLGLVLSPGGWAQGMRISADYYDIRVKDGIFTPFQFSSAASVIETCWRASGNTDVEGEPNYGQNIAPNMDVAACKDITFYTDANGNRDLTDIVYVNASRPENSLPYERRGIDLSLNYNFPLSRAFESLPGSMSFTVRASRALEASGLQQVQITPCDLIGGSGIPQDVGNVFQCRDGYNRVDMVGQIRSNVFIPGISPSPKWTGNIVTSYQLGDLSTSLSARYIGAAALDKTWADDPSDPRYQNEFGEFLNGSVDNNWVKPYMNFSLNGSYNLDVGDMKQFQVFGSINNLFDKSPPFTGGGISGASAGYHDTMGRAYRMGVRMRF
jgi:iron complex outermembrane receptor protein